MKTFCPNCKKLITAESDNKWLPFCSERCQLIDLGAWLNENHKISSDISESEDPLDKQDTLTKH